MLYQRLSLSILESFKANLGSATYAGKTSGSDVMFIHPKRELPFRLHKPHPQKELKPYVIKHALDELRDAGFI